MTFLLKGERPKKRKRRYDEGREEDECLDGSCKVESGDFHCCIADAVNKQMASRFA